MKRSIFLISLVTVACGSATDATTKTTTTTTTTSTTTSAAEDTFVAPAGWAVYGDKESGFRMAFPPGWVDIARMLDEDPEGFEEAIEGTSMEGLGPLGRQVLDQNGVLVLANPESLSDDYAENVNILVYPQGRGETLDTIGAAMPAQLELIGATEIAIADYLTARYPAVTIDYRLEEIGDVAVRQYLLLADGNFWIISFGGSESGQGVWDQAVDSFVVYDAFD